MRPRAEDVEIRDIAHALANVCRYNGHCRTHYSVAEHSVHVSYHVPADDALWGLLHDAAEAYLCDLPRPFKEWLRQEGIDWYDRAEASVMAAVCERFGLPVTEPPSIKTADLLLLVTESRDLMAPLDPAWRFQEKNGYAALPDIIEPLTPEAAEKAFLDRFKELSR